MYDSKKRVPSVALQGSESPVADEQETPAFSHREAKKLVQDLFPLLSYHSMGEAHRRLMNALPEDSPYKKGIFPGLWAALRELLRGARIAGRAGHNPVQVWRHPGTATYAR